VSLPNETPETAIALTSPCADAVISNLGADTTAEGDDPLYTVYGFAAPFSRQVWWKFTNTFADQHYARFTITNPTAGPIDIAGAVYLDTGMGGSLAEPVIVRTDLSDGQATWETPLPASGSFTLGVALDPGQTVWLELAGDDTEGDGHGWDGVALLEWQMLEATFYDTPDSFEGGTEFVAGFTDGISADTPEPVSYCKLGDLHFAALNDSGATDHFLVAVWTEGGGAPTIYTISDALIGLGFIVSSISKPYGPAAPQIRTDGTNLWVVAYIENDNSETCGLVSHAARQWVPAVFIWNGSGFDYIGSAPAECFPWTGGYQQQIGMISAAASSAEEGVLHVMWSESGVDQIDSATCAITTFGSFVHYTKWSTGGLVSSGDSLSSSAAGASPSSLVPYTSSYLFVTNAFGSPIAFYGYPLTLGLTSVSQAGNITYSDLIEMWAVDESSAAITLLQSAHGSTLIGSTVTLDASSFHFTAGGTRQQPQDPFGGVDTIFFQFPFGASPQAPLLNVPADGFGPIVVTTPALSAIGTEDAYDDSRNIWIGGGYINGASLTCSGGTSNFDLTDSNIFLSGGDAGRLELFYDAEADAFYTLGYEIESPDYQIAPVKVPILRDYLICTIGDCIVSAGLHVWQRT
jgi:hypothetical protein